MDTGGEAQASKHSDLSTLKSTLEAAVRAHYPAVANHIAVRLIPCRSVCSETLALLSRLVYRHLYLIHTSICELCFPNGSGPCTLTCQHTWPAMPEYAVFELFFWRMCMYTNSSSTIQVGQ